MPLPLIADVIPSSVSATVVHDGGQRDVTVDKDIDVSVGDQVELHFRTMDTQHPTYVVSGLPASAQATSVEDGVDVLWTPGDGDAGLHDLAMRVTDGPTTAERKVRIVVEHVHHAFFAPGAITTIYVPNDTGNLGVFIGGGVEIVIYAFTQKGHPWFPSHGRFYFDLEFLGSTQTKVDGMINGMLGFDISLERNPQRRFLLPVVGAEVGVAFQKQTGDFGWGMPLAGLYLWSSPQLRIAMRGGYLLPTTSAQDTRGVRIGASADVAWW
jgi:hypothetical protein